MKFPGAPKIASVIAFPFALTIGTCSSASAEDLRSFAILAGSTVTNTGTSIINGNIGVSPGTAIVGFPPGIVTAPYVIHANDGVAVQAQIDLVAAYNDLQGRPTTIDLTGKDLAGLVLGPGVYSFNTSAQLTGTLTLDAKGNPNAVFIVNIGSTLITSSGAAVALVNGAQGGNVYFVSGSSATLGTDTAFAGEILALTSITLNTNASINCGAALARNGAVTLDSNTISVCTAQTTPFGTVLTAPPTDGGTTTPPTTGGDNGTPTTGGGTTTPTTGGGSTTPTPTPVPTNALAVAQGLDTYIAAGGATPLLFNLLPAEALKTEFSELSGEISTAVAPAGNQAMNGFLLGVFNRLNDDQLFNTPPSNAPLPANTNRPGGMTVKALGYGADDPRPAQVASTMSAVDNGSTKTMPVLRPLSIWAAAYGDTSETNGDYTIGTHDRSVSTVGIVGGLDYQVTPNSLVGFALGAGGTNFDLADNYGSGSSDIAQVSIYGRTDFNAAYVAAALATSWNSVSTERSLSIGGDRFTADFDAYDVAGQIETGYRFAMPAIKGLPGDGWLTPYAALQVQAFYAPSYSETAANPASLFALDYDAQTTTTTYTELGARIGRTFLIDQDSLLTLRGRLAWAHDNWSNDTVATNFLSLPGVGFTVVGATPVADSLLVTLGADVQLAGGFSFGASLDGKLASEAQTYAGTGRLSYNW
ncbi:ice-binding family protein [Kaistia dalseonensis]|uniref:Uncharacterized protein with beta-barrel porin domain n=1 Tax=Kaistia dalseonensis TaxID=410840 RepID=A0ABU0H8Y4_9HYPH|nr:ice-binding family protein [Kaistia dalseonensis]MCX5496173.1 ice-binding family protein [Kaistia dalseonensis]MDQ0438783.1 uncharacterized protein with beta-barrel porin domain [Kaistia dalseonensis]